MNPDSTPDPTPFFSYFKEAKKIIAFHIFFLITYLHAHDRQSQKLNFLLNFVSKFYFASIISDRLTPLGVRSRIQIVRIRASQGTRLLWASSQ